MLPYNILSFITDWATVGGEGVAIREAGGHLPIF